MGALSFGSPGQVPEYAAEGDIGEVYHEIRQSLRATGVSLIFRLWASFGKFLPPAWGELRPNVESAAFIQAGDELREEGDRLAESLPRADGFGALGESRAYQIRAALEMYHDLNPKLLVLVCAARKAMESESLGAAAEPGSPPAPRGEPARMFPMEMELEKPEEKIPRAIFKELIKTFSLPAIQSDYRTLALWPDYLLAAWKMLKPVAQSREYAAAADQLRQRARELARRLPHPMSLSLGRIKEWGEDPEKVLAVTRQAEEVLPGLVLNLALLLAHWRHHEEEHRARRPPAAVEGAPEPAWRAFQKRQRIFEWRDQFVSYVDEGKGEPVLLLHGIPTWGFLWERTIANLSATHRAVAPDLLGYGYSSKRDNFDRSLAAQTDMLNDFIERLDLGPAHVVGHGLGGGIALRLAALHPGRVRSLTLLNCVCYDAWPVEMMLQLGHPRVARLAAPSATLKVLKKGLAGGFYQAPESAWLDDLLAPWRTEVGRLSLVRNASALNTSHTTEITRLLPAIQLPAVILWGEEDSFLPVRLAHRLAGDLSGASLKRVAEARHFVMVDQPNRVYQGLRQLLERQAHPGLRAAA